MTAIAIPVRSEEKQTEEGYPVSRDIVWTVCILSFLITLLVVAGFTLYMISVDIAPSCGTNSPVRRTTDVTFKRHGKLPGTDLDFEEESHYDHHHNALVTELSGGDARSENATVIEDYSKNVTARVLSSRRRCFLGALTSDDTADLSSISDGDLQELQYVRRHRYHATGPIAPGYLSLTAGPLVQDYCSGLQASWIVPSAEGSYRKRAAWEGPGLLIIGLPDGTEISDMMSRDARVIFQH